jgi:phage terminase large subunit
MFEELKKKDYQSYLISGEGEWGVSEGIYFKEFSEAFHTVEDYPVEYSDEYDFYASFDYGLDMLACYWIAMDTSGRAFVYRELYQSGLKVSEAAEAIKAMTPKDEKIYLRIAPPDLWNRRNDTGRSAADIFAENGLPLYKAQNDRVQGWYDLAEWLRPCMDEFGNRSANLRIFENCTNLIRCLPSLIRDQRNPNDCAKEPHEITHAPDALRYFCAGRPVGTYVPPERDEDYVTYDDQWSNILSYGR